MGAILNLSWGLENSLTGLDIPIMELVLLKRERLVTMINRDFACMFIQSLPNSSRFFPGCLLQSLIIKTISNHLRAIG
jgi:hypothetical protein